MPIYEYRCGKCGHRVEILQKMGSNSAGEPCPACGSTELEKVISAHNVGKASSNPPVPSCATTGTCSPGGCCGGCGHGHHH